MVELFGREAPRLVWVCVFASGLLLLLDVSRVSAADSQVDSDLVFDNLDQGNENHHRIGRDVERRSIDSSPKVEGHWLSNTVDRIKRSLHSLLSSKSKKTNRNRAKRKPLNNGLDDYAEPLETEDEYDEGAEDDYDPNEDDDYAPDDDVGDYNENSEEGPGQDGETDDVDDGQAEGDDVVEGEIRQDNDYEEGIDENEMDYGSEPQSTNTTMVPTTTTEDSATAGLESELQPDESPSGQPIVPSLDARINTDHFVDNSNTFTLLPELYGIQTTTTQRTRNESHINEDDEDNLVDSSGEGSTDGSTPTPVVDSPHPVYYRIVFTVSEPFVEDFKDRNSFKYRDFSEELIREIDDLYVPVPGTQSATVISIEKRDADAFTAKVTVDLGSDGYNNEQVIRDVLFKHIESHHRLGKITALPDDFQLRVFDVKVPPYDCDVNELPCHNGACVPSEARCNGISECSDHSDEAGCGGVEPPAITTTTTTTTEPPATTPEEDIEGSGELSEKPSRCRADDVIRCDDNSGLICADQICDGTKNCDNGSDELNCDFDCAEGEFGCDVSRCIQSNKRCDGVFDCDDRTDETGCLVCAEDEVTCDNKCVTREQRCDGRTDCQDGSDERNCPESQCSPGQINCGDGTCFYQDQRCDGRADCPNGQDELNCTGECGSDQFRCSDGTCIQLSKKCNRIYDCKDLSDETNGCPCGPEFFTCDNGFCIPPGQRCNGINNCQDRSDERGCNSTRPEKCLNSTGEGCKSPYSCTSDEFRCEDGHCIRLSQRCDGTNNCISGEDEKSCAFCSEHQFKCSNGDCVDERKKCDGRVDCDDSSDELNCKEMRLHCQAQHWRCHDNLKCIPERYYCDGKTDCQDKSDESFCSSELKRKGQGICDETEFECAAGFCVMGYKRCNGIVDCPSGNDEDDCPPTTTVPVVCDADQVRCNDVCGKRCDGIIDCIDASDEHGCPRFCTPDQFRCNDGGCVGEHQRCDGTVHCSDGSDERDCVLTCAEDEFRCTNGVCLDGKRQCDGYSDCSDGSDEKGCKCTSQQFNCGDSCIEASFRCDNYADCPDGSDEIGCPPAKCAEDQFACTPDHCIPKNEVCDGKQQCDDGIDEQDCPGPRCTSNEFRCDNGQCIPLYLVCSGTPECSDRSDERECRTCHQPEWFQCMDGTCVDFSLRCDNFYDCRDFSDEQNCFECHSDQFQCSNGDCIADYLRCNRRNDCRDGSDEYNCPTEPPFVTETPEPPPRQPQPLNCAPGSHPCHTGDRCILRSQFCDGRVDCNDMSDETNCSSASEDLNLKTYPNAQEIKENREVVFQCRDEGPIRARVRWTRPDGQPLPPHARVSNGRLEIPNIKVEHSGTYICEAVGYPPNKPGAQVFVHLQVDPWTAPPTRPPTACALHEATCANGECIPKQRVCDGKYDCTDGSDENRCNPNGCEPNQFRCANKKCVLKTWRCDGDNDCGDGSDEDSCATNPPGSLCAYHQFACHSSNQCIPKSYHCDLERDCIDNSDEIGCALPVVSKPPPPMVTLELGSVFEITCTAVGVPTPEIVWRLNWGHIPAKCRTTSEGGFGTLHCPDIQIEDQGAYSCEVINIKGTVFAIPDTILVVHKTAVCSPGYFNEVARSESECIKCFCFGQSNKCRSADLFIYQFQPPFDTLKLLGVQIDPNNGVLGIRDEPIYRNIQPQLSPVGRNGVHSYLPAYAELTSNDLVPYFAMPENYHGNQLKSYGGYLRFTVNQQNQRYSTPGPTVILTGNGYTLLSKLNHSPQGNRPEKVEIRFFVGDWIKKTDSYPETLATREEIMMVLEDVDNILLKLQYNEGQLNTTISNIEMESAASPNSGLGPASYVEECECPVGYSGTSCERCADGFERHKNGPWLGQCQRVQTEVCSAGTYGDPSRGRPCEVCPCPHTNPSNQFARTCSLGPDGDVVCDCPPEYVGRRCEQCATGYSGNPLVAGDYCRPTSTCDALGSTNEEQGRCRCKDYVEGSTCSSCKQNTFYLSRENQFGCISCFCMGITRECTSSNWYRDEISSAFTTSRNNFKLIDNDKRSEPIDTGIRLDQNRREIVYANFANSNVHYWSLPSRFLGNKITSYGGHLRYTLRYVPLPGGQSSRNSAADVELISNNEITLQYYAREHIQPTGNPQTFTVPLYEQYWQRSDGQMVNREHLLMALADLRAIYIKATYNTNTRESALISVSLDIANEHNTGSTERALAVEQCRCGPGYKGLSCEECDFGYTKTDDGLYLGICQPCNCNGNSNECDPRTGVCSNCKHATTGDNCQDCLPGYEGDPANRIPCRYIGGSECNCNAAGSISSDCVNGVCQCKGNVEGNNCDRCRSGTFGLDAASIDGCQVCFCSGVSSECSEGNYYYEQIPTVILYPETHGFTLTDQYQRQRIDTEFTINPLKNEIGYTFRPSNAERWYWALPRKYSGNHIKSYGGKLEFTQRYNERPQAVYVPDQDIIIIGNGITIYWTNPQAQPANTENRISVALNPNANWHRLDGNNGPRPASREDILKALANIDVILVRAQQSSDTESSYLSDVTLDTALEQNAQSPLPSAVEVEVCRCPPGYKGSSCESCAPGYYRDPNDFRTGVFGSCSRCPCNNNEESCKLDTDHRVTCVCLPGYFGRECQSNVDNVTTTTPGPLIKDPPLTMEITINAPKIEIYKVGSTVRFNCSVRSLLGRGPIRVHWAKDGGSLPEHALDDGYGILVITKLRASDSGRYICEASDGQTIESKDIVVTVGPSEPEPPRVVISPSFVDVQEGQSLQIQCAASGNPEPTLRLIRLNGEELNPNHYFDNGLFRIQEARKSDQGPYQCIATNAAGSHSSNVDIYVRENNEGVINIDVSPSRIEGNSGESFILRCQTDRTANIKWSRSSGSLPYNSVEDQGVLTVTGARPEDSGTYICTATSQSGYSAIGTAEVRIHEAQVVYPTARVTPERITISQGASIELTCEATGILAPAIKWTRVGSELPPHITQNGPILHIRNAQITDRAVYVCVTSNVHGFTQASAVVEVNRLEIPILSIYPKPSQTIVAGNSAILQCRLEAGIPTPTLTWTRDNHQALSPNIEKMSDGTLRFTQITPNEAGQYVCTAENEAGTTTAVASIVVNVRPTIRVVPNEEVIMRPRGEFIRLECRATGTPSPSVQWRKHDNSVQYSGAQGPTEVLRGGTPDVAVLEIERFSAQDEGVYVCEASNEAGTEEKNVQLVIASFPSRGDIVGEDSTGTSNEGPPEGGYKSNEGPYLPPPPRAASNYVERIVAPAGTRAEIRCTTKNSTIDVKNGYVEWSRPGRTYIPGSSYQRGETLYIDNVQPAAAGDYICTSRDDYNRELFSVTVRLDVVSPPRITLDPPRQVVHPGDNARIQCSATGQQPIRILWIPVGRKLPTTVITHDGLIQFNNIQLSDAGRYRCSASNDVGTADAVADVIVEENIHRPALTAENHQQTAPVGSSVTLRCRAQDPSVRDRIKWFREQLPLPTNSRINGEYFHITDLQIQDEGRYYCEVPTNGGASSDYIDLRVTRPSKANTPPPTLHITPSQTSNRIGEHIDITCQSSEPGVIATWSKLGGWLADNVQNVGGTLRITSLKPENDGTYRCEATGHQGVYHKDYNLNIINEHAQDEPPIEVKTVQQGASILMECKTDLEAPVSYEWSKQGKALPRDVDIYSRTIQLNDVSIADAGTYICKQSNKNRKIDTPTILTVTGIVPHFAQAPNSYIALQSPFPDPFIQVNFEISFKPQSNDGFILYNGNKGNDKSGDFISLTLVNGVPEFRYNLGYGVTIVKADNPVVLNQWHTIKVIRNRRKATMFVDGRGPFVGNAEGKYFGLDLSEPLYLGGVPNHKEISPEAGVYNGFVGCISRFKIDFTHKDIIKQAVTKHGITNCETCSENKCENDGVCQESLSAEGYYCICPAGFSGPTCNKLKGEACSPYACGAGRCVDTENSFECLCPLGRSGSRCEHEITVNEPAFSNGAYIAYPPLKSSSRRFKISLKIKSNDAKDGILLYAAETDEGYGDFVSLAVRNRHLEFTFNVGGRPTTIRSEKEVAPGAWHVLTAIRSLSEGQLVIDGDTTFGTTPRNHKVLNLLTPLFIGGYDRQNVKINGKVGVYDGFNGCISDVDISDLDLELVNSAIDAANVGDCSAADNTLDNAVEDNASIPSASPYDSKRTGCSSNPCKNGGQCYPLSPIEYKCSCLDGYEGRDCEIRPNLCAQLSPCQNGGSCNGNSSQYECECPLGVTGTNCEHRVQLRNDVHFSGNGYLEFDKNLLDHVKSNDDEVIAFELSTNTSNGLVFWHGQTPNEDGQGQDYLSLGVVNGYLELSYDLGSGPAIIRNSHVRVDDGHRHSVILKRRGRKGSIEVDFQYVASGESPGLTTSLSTTGNIYLGGSPNLALMTGNKFMQGFNGCIYGFEIQNLKTLDLSQRAISGLNAKPCSSIDVDENNLVH